MKTLSEFACAKRPWMKSERVSTLLNSTRLSVRTLKAMESVSAFPTQYYSTRARLIFKGAVRMWSGRSRQFWPRAGNSYRSKGIPITSRSRRIDSHPIGNYRLNARRQLFVSSPRAVWAQPGSRLWAMVTPGRCRATWLKTVGARIVASPCCCGLSDKTVVARQICLKTA